MKDCDNRKKRKKGVILKPLAYIALSDHREEFPKFDLSAWVSNKIIEEFGVNKKQYALMKIHKLEEERDFAMAKFQRQITLAAEEFKSIKDEEDKVLVPVQVL